MKASLTIVALAVMLPSHAAGSCSLGGYSAWPPRGPVPTNTLILVGTYGHLSGSLPVSTAPGVAELRGGGEVIPLEPILHFGGRWAREQVLFKPVRWLTPGVEYEIFVPALEDGPLTWISFEKGDLVPYRWVAQESADLTPPVWVARPRVVEKRYVNWACGSEIEVDVQLPARESGPVLVLAEVTPTGSTRGESRAYLLPVDGVASIGRGMCGGAFDLEPGGEYLLRPVLLDAAGNRAEPWTSPLRFRALSEPEPPRFL